MNHIYIITLIILLNLVILIALLNTSTFFDKNVLEMKTIAALFLFQISFNINHYLMIIYNFYIKELVLKKNFLNIIIVNSIIYINLISLYIYDYVKFNNVDNTHILILSMVGFNLLVFSENCVNKFNLTFAHGLITNDINNINNDINNITNNNNNNNNNV